MDVLEAYTKVGRMLEQMPDWDNEAMDLSRDAIRWLGRAAALIDETAAPIDMADFRTAVRNIKWPALRARAETDMLLVLEKVLAVYENALPASAQGAFIQAGAAFDAFGAVARVLQAAQRDVLLVDPYADHTLLTDFLPLANEGVRVRVLRDAGMAKLGERIAAATARWREQHGDGRPLEIRSTQPRVLHDRLIILDGTTAYALSQSFKDLAARSHASLIKADPETSTLKVQAYEQTWAQATPL